MQLMPGTAQRYGVANRQDPRANVLGGTRYLKDLLGMFDDNLVLALAAYNAGENAVIKYGHKIPPYEETQTYVRRVLKYYNDYKKTM
jgi:soluble lytic murein transglycosylase-like protein